MDFQNLGFVSLSKEEDCVPFSNYEARLSGYAPNLKLTSPYYFYFELERWFEVCTF